MKQLLVVLFLTVVLFSCKKEDLPLSCSIVNINNDDEFFKGDTVPIIINASDPDNFIKNVEVFIDDDKVASFDGSFGIYNWITTNEKDGSHAIKAVAINDKDLKKERFITVQLPPIYEYIPIIETVYPIYVGSNFITLGGDVLKSGKADITERGLCWNETGNPSIESGQKSVVNGTIGYFKCTIDGLAPNKEYFIKAYATNKYVTVYGKEITVRTNVTGITIGEMVSIESATFQMGSNYFADEMPIHPVTLSAYRIGKYEFTVAQYCDYLNYIGQDYSLLEFIGQEGGIFYPKSGCSNFPVYEISYNEVISLCEWANGSLPTEAEWEFAARGGSESMNYTYSGSNNIDDVAWYIGNTNEKAEKIGLKLSNELGIYDMSGNVAEWCQDYYDANYYQNSPLLDPQGPETGNYKVIRGGSWNKLYEYAKVTRRFEVSMSYLSKDLGFRLRMNP